MQPILPSASALVAGAIVVWLALKGLKAW